MSDLSVEEEVFSKLVKLGVRCTPYRGNWKQLSKDQWWSGFEMIIRRWGCKCTGLNTMNKRMGVLRTALREMELGHKMLKADDVKQRKKPSSIRALGAMLDRLEGKYPGCFAVSYQWPIMDFVPNRIAPKRKAPEPSIQNPPKRAKRAPVQVEVPCSEYTFDLNDPDPFRKKQSNPFRKAVQTESSFKPTQSQYVSQQAKSRPGTMVVQIPPSPFRRTQHFQPSPKSPILEQDEMTTSKSHNVQQQEPTQNKPILQPSRPKPKDSLLNRARPQENRFDPPKPQPTIIRDNAQPNRFRNDFNQQTYIRNHQPMQSFPERRKIPEYEPLGETFLDKKMKEYGNIGGRSDLTMAQRLELMDANKKEREEYVKNEKNRFQEYCRKQGIKVKWDDLLEPEANFQWLDFHFKYLLE